MSGQSFDELFRQLSQPGQPNLGTGLLDQFMRAASHQSPSQRLEPTLSPQALHNNTPPLTAIAPSAFYSAHPVPNTPSTTATTASTPTPPLSAETLQAKKDAFHATIRPLLAPDAFSGAKHVQKLVGHIDDYGSAVVDAPLRLEILTKMRDNAGNHYFRAWSESVPAMDITREWLKAGLTAKAEGQLVETIMPLLHVSRSGRFSPHIH
jgi:protein phosphatase 1 regulatory subunit 10